MNTLKIIDFIKEHKNWFELLTAPPYSLNIKEKGNLLLFNYNQIYSVRNNEITKESRGLILDKNTLQVIRMGFYRFFNLDEPECESIDLNTCIGLEKLDGTLIFLYYYDNKWHVGTRSTFDAQDAPLNNNKYKNFKELFDDIIKLYPNFSFNSLNKNYTYCLEMCSRNNAIVIDYDEPKLFHLLTRDNSTLEEIAADIGLPKPKMYIFSSEKDYRKLVESFDKSHEGIVLKDAAGHRAKLKSKLYFDLHRMINNNQITPEIVLDKIRTGEDSEFLTYFPEYEDYFGFIQNEYLRAQIQVILTQQIADEWKASNPFANRKDYAFFVKDRKPQVLYFKAYDNKAEEWFNSLTSAQLVKIFKIGG